MNTMYFYRHFGKRWLDVFIAGTALLCTLPIFLVVAIFVWCHFGPPILFCQRRPGLHERLFRMYKFRTMTEPYDAEGNQLSDGQRLTPFGRWLRSTSLDELPELWNVLRGEMSLVGPRPLLPDYLSLYTPRQRRRHEVKPGLTGLAQVNGRNSIDWATRLEIDASYADQMSLQLDGKILFDTVTCVLQRRGINANAHETMPRFTGQASFDSESQAA
jgi:sugar transferase EpsL